MGGGSSGRKFPPQDTNYRGQALRGWGHPTLPLCPIEFRLPQAADSKRSYIHTKTVLAHLRSYTPHPPASM